MAEDIEGRLARIVAEVPLETNRATLERFLLERRMQGCKLKTLLNEANALRHLARHLDRKRFEEASHDDMVRHLADTRVERRWVSKRRDGSEQVTYRKAVLGANTRAVRCGQIRFFYKWLLGDGEEYPAQVKRLRIRRGDADAIPVDELVTAEDLEQLLQAHQHPRDKAIFTVLYEGGFRASELCSIRLRSVRFDEYGAVILLPKDGTDLKTGARRVRLVDSASYLQAWVEAHPCRDEPDAPLFTSLYRARPRTPLNGSGLYTFLQAASRRAGLKKHIHPHLFRHSSATEKARQGWSDKELRAYFGWSPRSTMPARYVHLAGLDYEAMMLERLGKKPSDPRRSRALRPRTCPTCNTENPSTNLFCAKCRRPVAPGAEEELQKRQEEALDDRLKEHLAKMVAGYSKEELASLVMGLAGG